MSAIRILTSVLLLVALAAGGCVLVGGYLHLNRSSFLRPVTGRWVGVLTSDTDPADQRVVSLDTSVSASRLSSPTLIGTIHMCSQSGEATPALLETRTVSSDTLGVMIATADSKDTELFGALRGNGLSVQFGAYHGTMQRADAADYAKACKQLQH